TRNLCHLIIKLANVSGVYPYPGATRVDRRENVVWLEVNVGNHGNLTFRRNDGKCLGVVPRRARNANDVATGCRELGNLLQGRIDISGLRRGHPLHAHRSPTADRHRPDLYSPRRTPWREYV